MNKKSIQFAIHPRFSAEEKALIDQAYQFAADAHEGQLRKSGDPYLTHPVAVALLAQEWGIDHVGVIAALLHDTVEDTRVTLDDITARFGQETTKLVDGLTKLGAITAEAKHDPENIRREISNENLRKLLLASTEDLRVLVLKLADRLHNLRTLQHLGPDKRLRIARESLEIYAPLADRLGMGQLKAEMEDLAFRFAYPDDFARTARLVASTTRANRGYLEELKIEIGKALVEAGLEPLSIEARQKHLYSVYKKLAKVEGDITKIYDLVAVRVIIEGITACYQTLGVLHQRYRPMTYRIKDYIAVPKPNGYRSLHTTVFATGGHITEIQIRTPAMHEEAEQGLAAHFYYNEQKLSQAYQQGETGKVPSHMAWVNDLAEVGRTIATGQELDGSARLELFADRIFVFSPKGDLYELADGATPLDFAFAVHSDLGLRTLGAKVNGRMVPLDSRLENRDMVEILTRREPQPNRDWLAFVQTNVAKTRIRAWFRAISRDANLASGRALVEEALPAWGYRRVDDVPAGQWEQASQLLNAVDREAVLAAVGEGSLTVASVMRRLFPPTVEPPTAASDKAPSIWGVIFEGPRLPYILAACCAPHHPQRIIGYVTRGSGVTVHRLKCPNLPAEPDRYVSCKWGKGQVARVVRCQIAIEADDRVGLLSDITAAVAVEKLSISGVSSNASDIENEAAEISFHVQVPDLYTLAQLMQRLRRLSGVNRVTRIQ